MSIIQLECFRQKLIGKIEKSEEFKAMHRPSSPPFKSYESRISTLYEVLHDVEDMIHSIVEGEKISTKED